MTEFFNACREVNVVLGIVGFVALCYRAGFGIAARKIVYWPLLIVLCFGALILMLGAPTGVFIGHDANYLSPFTTLYWSALIVVCFFYPGPFRRGP